MLRPDGLPHPASVVEVYLAAIYDLLRARLEQERPKLHQAAPSDPEVIRVKDSRGKK